MSLNLIQRKWMVVLASTVMAASTVAQESNIRFASARTNGTNFVMDLAGIGELSCVLESAVEIPGQWMEVTLAAPLADGLIEVPMDGAQRFFRVRCDDTYSVNGAGYVTRELTPGFQLIANPFDNGGNTLAEVLGQDWPFGTAVYQFDAGHQAFVATQIGSSDWLSDSQRLTPGTGAFIQVVTPVTLVLCGLFDDSHPVAEVQGGWSLVGSTVGTTTEIVPEEGDSLAIWTGESYVIHTFEFGEWMQPVPATELGEGFWYYRNRPGAVPPSGGCVLFTNFGPALGHDTGAPQFDPLGCRMEGTNWLAQLYAGPDESSLVPVGEPVPFLSGTEEGFFNTGSNAVRYIESVAPGGIAVVVINMWSALDGDTYEEAAANGGYHGTTAYYSVLTGGAGNPPSLPAGLTDLVSSGGMGNIWVEVSGGGSYFVGQSALLIATYDYVTSRPVAYQWERGTPDQIVEDESGNPIWIPGTWSEVEGATEPVLELSPLAFEDADHYRFVIRIDGCANAPFWNMPIELTVLPTHSFSNPSIDPATGAFSFTLAAESTLDFAIEYSADLAHWTLLKTILKPTSPVEIIEVGLPEVQQRFYRARVLWPQ
jgi:hypothetical protein